MLTISDREPAAATMSSAIRRTVISSGLPMLTGPGCAAGEGEDPRDEVVHIADGSRLQAVACEGDRLVTQGLPDEGRDGATVVGRMRGPYVLKMRTMPVSTPSLQR